MLSLKYNQLDACVLQAARAAQLVSVLAGEREGVSSSPCVDKTQFFITIFLYFFDNFNQLFNQSKFIIFTSFFLYSLFNIHILTILKKITKKDSFNIFLFEFKMTCFKCFFNTFKYCFSLDFSNLIICKYFLNKP